jgi:hypothetical protein
MLQRQSSLNLEKGGSHSFSKQVIATRPLPRYRNDQSLEIHHAASPKLDGCDDAASLPAI